MAVVDPIEQFYARIGRYPGNNKQWWLARSEVDDDDNGLKAGDFIPEILDKLFAGNMRAPKGHFILHAFEKDRSFVSGVEDIPIESTTERPTSVAFFSGRTWFACKSTVYFSQILSTKYKAGLCFQEADPTSEHVSDPVDTDGGVIPIPEADKIIKLVPNGGGVLVFARNGVWNITGTEAGFTATDISVNKVSPIGCKSPFSVVETETSVFWWSDVGIMGMQQSVGAYGPITGSFDKANISEETIQTFYNSISASAKEEVKGVYDPKANVVMWLFRDDDVGASQYNKVLIYDVAVNAFYPWKFSELAADPVFIKGLFVSNRLNEYTISIDIDPSQVEYVTIQDEDVRFAQVRSGEFSDWFTADDVGVAYDSYVETGFELFDDAMRDKNITYLFSYFRRTETSIDDITYNDPSSCYLTVKFDWSSGSNSNKWTTPVQAYRLGRAFLSDPDTGFGMVVTKNKVRGNGKALQFRFGTDEIGKNFDLQGWSIAVSGNTNP